MSGILLSGGAAALIAVFAYIQTVRLKSAQQSLRSAELTINNLWETIDALRSSVDKLDDPDERNRLREKLRVKRS